MVAIPQQTMEMDLARPPMMVMIESSFIHLLTAISGGVSMIDQLVSTENRVRPVHVWIGLTADRQAGAIRLMAQLAFNLVLAQSDSLVKEPRYDKPTHRTQNPA
jgi:hypothetical protein